MNVALDPASYDAGSLENVLTPALAIYPEIVRWNIERMLALLEGDARRWRPHVKTAKLGLVMRLLVERGVKQFKCATTLELLVACESGAEDVLVAYPHAGANALRIARIARDFPGVKISALVEAREQIAIWKHSPVSLFVDINPGMDRTGIAEGAPGAILDLVSAIEGAGIEFRGLHYYDGHITDPDIEERTRAAHRGYDRLMAITEYSAARGITVPEVITSGTPAFPCSLTYTKFRAAPFRHSVSPGTVVYCDVSSLRQLPEEYQYRPAALVISRVISHPRNGVITCDAGHKSLSVDAGVPNCVVLENPRFEPLRPSEEHLPMKIPAEAEAPALGSLLHLIPRHICPTVNNFDFALIVENGEIAGVEPVSARGREGPLLAAGASAR